MKDNKTSVIIKEFFNIISPFLTFTADERIAEIEKNILFLLCESKDSGELFEECKALIDETVCLQSFSDANLLLATDASRKNIAYDTKMNVLSACKINTLKSFDEVSFTEELKNAAAVGNKNACKLLAFLSWLGIITPQNRTTAQNIWSTLAMSGDIPSIEMLIYSFEKTNQTDSLKKWSNIHQILKNELESFSAVALYSTYPEYTEEEIQTANIIMFIHQAYAAKENIYRPMLYYVLNSKDDYDTKMNRLSAETNFYIALHNEDKLQKKHCGFLAPGLE